jgi:hypothetical protein
MSWIIALENRKEVKVPVSLESSLADIVKSALKELLGEGPSNADGAIYCLQHKGKTLDSSLRVRMTNIPVNGSKLMLIKTRVNSSGQFSTLLAFSSTNL